MPFANQNPSSGGGAALTVTDGTTSVANVSTVKFTSGVTVTNAGGGEADAAVTGASITFTPTATKITTYTAAANEWVPCDTTGGAFTVTLPAAPANGTVVAVELIAGSGSVTVAAGAGDTLNNAVTTVVGTQRRTILYTYRSSDKQWFALSPFSSTAVTSVAVDGLTVVNAGTSLAPNLHTGTLDVIAANQAPAADWSNNSHKITSLANGTAASDAAAFGQIPFLGAIPVTGQFFCPPTDGASHTAAAMTQNNEYATPIPFSKAGTITSLVLRCTTLQASTVIRVGIRQDNNGIPGTLLLDAGTVDTSTAGNKTIGSLSQSVGPGLVWFTATWQGGAACPTMVVIAQAGGWLWRGANPNFSGTAGFFQTGVSGALPGTFTNGGYIDNQQLMPLILVGF